MPVVDAAAALSGEATLSPGATAVFIGSASFFGSGSIGNPSATLLKTAEASFVGGGVLSATGVFLIGVTLTGAGYLSATSEISWVALSAIEGEGSLSAMATASLAGDATLDGAGTLLAATETAFQGVASLVGSGDLTATALGDNEAAADISGDATVNAVLSQSFALVESLGGTSGGRAPQGLVRKPFVAKPRPASVVVDPLFREKPPRQTTLHPTIRRRR